MNKIFISFVLVGLLLVTSSTNSKTQSTSEPDSSRRVLSHADSVLRVYKQWKVEITKRNETLRNSILDSQSKKDIEIAKLKRRIEELNKDNANNKKTQKNESIFRKIFGN